MNAVFDWEYCSDTDYTFVKNLHIMRFVDRYIFAQILYLTVQNVWSCAIYGDHRSDWKDFLSLDTAKKYVKNILIENNIKVLGDEYKVLV